MAHAGHGVDRGCAGRFDWVAALARIYARDPEIWFSFPNHIHLGPSGRTVQGATLYLRNTCFFAHRAPDCSSPGYRHSSVSDRACAIVDSAGTGFTDRNAGGNSERDPWLVGNFRHDPVAARLSISIPQAVLRLDTALQWTDLRAVHVCWRNHHCHNDSADHHFGFARDLAQCPGFATGSRLRAGRDSLGGNPNCSFKLCEERLVRRGDSRFGARSWRNDGRYDGDRQDTADRLNSLYALFL